MKMHWSYAIVALAVCCLPATAGGDPGCPPSFCDPVGVDNPDGIARLSLFPGTPSVIHDNGPGDLAQNTCGVIVASNVPFPGAPYSTGSALFSGRIEMMPATSSTAFAGELRVTNATISNPLDASGTPGADFIVTNPLPLACGEFFWDQGGLPSVLQVKIDGTVEVEDDGTAGGGMIQGSEELSITAVARSFTMVSPVFSTPPSELGVFLHVPISAPSPHPIYTAQVGTGTYANGEGIIGLLLGAELPSGELFRLPTSIEAGFGDVPPPTVPAGGGTTTPLVVQKVDPAGSSLSMTWDTASCPGAGLGHSLLYGYGFQLPGAPGEPFGLAGAECGIGPEGTFMWENVPDGAADPMLWWLMVAHGGSENEGSWGPGSNSEERIGPGAGGSSDECGMATKAVAENCEP